MSALAISKVEAYRGELPDMPIEAAWVLEGKPIARGTVLLQSADKLISSGLWTCTAGRFRWVFAWDEFVHVLEGEATIRAEGGESQTLRAGDCAHFPRGLKTEWHVPNFVRKFFTLRTPEAFHL
ncbi:MAG: DUF861 domain-containing protein [Planctomycetes bacterium]|nr:DUF861 domain-containing protein [Planctomycetota bacterium]